MLKCVGVGVLSSLSLFNLLFLLQSAVPRSAFGNFAPAVKVEDLLSLSHEAQGAEVQKVKLDPKDVEREESDEEDEDERPDYSLIEAVKNGATGNHLESEEIQKALLESAKWYLKVRPDWKRANVRMNGLASCEKIPTRKPFCNVLEDFGRRDGDAKKHRSLLSIFKSIRSRYQVGSWIRQGDDEKLAHLSDSDIRAGLRRVDSLSSLEKLVNRVASSSSCKNLKLTQTLGSKVEEFLPQDEAQQAATRLYERVASCGSSEASLRARYRLSLFYIWKDQCNKALPNLDYLTEHAENNDFHSRALFWKIHCIENDTKISAAGDNKVEAVKSALIKKYPFSFHTLLIQKEGISPKSMVAFKEDSNIHFRAEQNKILNDKMTVIEALMDLKEFYFAKEILFRMSDEVNAAEPEFRLYVGSLYIRLNEYIRSFRLLTSSFRESPKLVSKASLELYFPKNSIPVKAAPMTEIGPKFLLSLIRQESAFNMRARSTAGAMGLMQLMPSTARRFERIKKYDMLFDPALNLRIGSKYFAGLLDRFGGDAELALAAYNAGPRRVDQWLTRYPVKNRILFLDLIPFKETREYVASIARNYFWYSHLYTKDIDIGGNLKFGDRIAQKDLGEVFRILGAPSENEEGVIP